MSQRACAQAARTAPPPSHDPTPLGSLARALACQEAEASLPLTACEEQQLQEWREHFEYKYRRLGPLRLPAEAEAAVARTDDHDAHGFRIVP